MDWVHGTLCAVKRYRGLLKGNQPTSINWVSYFPTITFLLLDAVLLNDVATATTTIICGFSGASRRDQRGGAFLTHFDLEKSNQLSNNY